MGFVRKSWTAPLGVCVGFCALLVPALVARGATLGVSDLMVFYASQSPAGAQGTIEFNLRFQSFDGPQASYDTFSAQVAINQILRSVPAVFTLDTMMTEDTAAIPEYWLPDPAAGDPLASTQDGEFRFRDRISLALPPVTPAPGNILAHFVIGFNVGPSGFGTYQIAMGNAGSNFFSRSIFPSTANSITPNPDEDTFMLVAPEPTSGLLVLCGGMILLRRRRV